MEREGYFVDKKAILWKNQQEALEKLLEELKVVTDLRIPTKDKKKIKNLIRRLEHTIRKLKKVEA